MTRIPRLEIEIAISWQINHANSTNDTHLYILRWSQYELVQSCVHASHRLLGELAGVLGTKQRKRRGNTRSGDNTDQVFGMNNGRNGDGGSDGSDRDQQPNAHGGSTRSKEATFSHEIVRPKL